MTSPTSRRRRVALAAVGAAALSLLAAASANAQATRTWVSGVGDDVNPCSRTAPCKTLAGTISKTAVGGEINALDSGGFGAVTITKSITIDLSPQLGGVLVAGTNGITVNSADADVTLRGLDLVGTGTTNTGACITPALTAVSVLQAHSVTLEDSRISGFSVAGVKAANTGDLALTVDNVQIRNACPAGGVAGAARGEGIWLAPGVGGTVTAAIRNATITNVGNALNVGDSSTAWLQNSLLFGNTQGLAMSGTGVINQFADTQVFGNATDGTPTKILGAPAPGADGAPGAPGAQGPVGPAGPATPTTIAIRETSITAASGHRARVHYIATTDGTGLVTVRRNGKVCARFTAELEAGANEVTWNGRIKGKRAPAGTYSMTIALTGADGATSTSRIPVIIR